MNIRSDVLTAVIMKSFNFCDIILCIPFILNRRFEGTRRLHLHGVLCVPLSCVPLAYCLAYLFDHEN
jgi:hypothetical protein